VGTQWPDTLWQMAVKITRGVLEQREVTQALGANAERVKALQAQLRRRLAGFCAKTRGGVAEMLEEMAGKGTVQSLKAKGQSKGQSPKPGALFHICGPEPERSN
jgi:hypothetical protein